MKIEFLDLLVKASVPAIVVIGLYFFRTRIRISPDRFSRRQIEDLDGRFYSIKWIPPLCMFAVGVLFVVGVHAALAGLNYYFATRQHSNIQLFPQPVIWWFFPGFGALCLSWEITLQLWAVFGDRKTADLYGDWSNMTTTMSGWTIYGLDSRRALRLLTLVIAFPIGIFTLLALPMHATVGPDSIVDCSYGFKGCSTYGLVDARRITAIRGFRTRDGKLNVRAALVIDFADGRRWSSAYWGDWKKEVDPALAALLVTKTRLPIGTATTEEDIPPMPSAIPDLTR